MNIWLGSLFLLLPVAAFSGWWIGRRSPAVRTEKEHASFSSDYFAGLNYLLNEQQDKAIEVFIRMLEVDSDTVETHFALANLFRRRGEADRAIRIHQNLIARPTLSQEQRNQALFELGRDYMSAGLLDRAESLFQELVNDPIYGQQSLRQLLDIFQQEKDWEKAIVVARRLATSTGEKMQPMIAHYYCEQAETVLQDGHHPRAAKLVKRALTEDRACVRASILEGTIDMERSSFRAAIRAFKRVEQQDPSYLQEITPPLLECYKALGRQFEVVDYLRKILQQHNNTSIMLALADMLQQQGGEESIGFITSYLRKRPSVRGLEYLIRLKLPVTQGQSRDDLLVLKDLTSQLLEQKPGYQCENCGFTGKTLHWQCPSCKQWNSVKPIQASTENSGAIA